MVKRQTVWLSTMMVLSLMLIGYYTMNNESSLTTSSQTSKSSVTTATGGTTNSSSASASTSPASSTNQTAASSQNATGASTGTPTTTTDWFVNMQTQLDTEMTKQIDAQTQVLSNNNATADQLSQAEDKLRQLQNEQGALANAKEMILAKGYQDCVIVPSSNGGKVVVYVKASSLSNTKAVEIMNIVSQQLNTSASNIVVQVKS